MSFLLMLTLASALPPADAQSHPVELLLQTLCAVGPQAAGHRPATRAWRQLAQCDARQLPEILAGLDAAGPVAATWICTAVDAIVVRQLQRDAKLPVETLEAFALDRHHTARARWPAASGGIAWRRKARRHVSTRRRDARLAGGR